VKQEVWVRFPLVTLGAEKEKEQVKRMVASVLQRPTLVLKVGFFLAFSGNNQDCSRTWYWPAAEPR